MNDVNNIIHLIESARKKNAVPAFAYDRISDKQQAEGLSLAYQESHAAQYAARASLEVVHYFTVIESARGTTVRKVFNHMIDLALEHGVKDLIFKNTDRMSRNYRDLLRIEELVEQGFNIHFYQTFRVLSMKSTYADRFILNVEIAAARQLSDKLSHDTRENQLFKAGRGVAPLTCPVGYLYDKAARIHAIDPATRPMMRLLFDTFDAGGHTLQALADYLNGLGYQAATGNRWTISSLHYILTSPFYHGEFLFQGKLWPGSHEPYYSKERFLKRRAILESLKLPAVRARKYSGGKYVYGAHEFAFRRLLSCPLCKKTLSGDRKKGQYVYYGHRCGNARNATTVSEARILELVDAAMDRVSFGPAFYDTIKRLFLEAIEAKTEDQRPTLTAIDRQIAKIHAKYERVVELFAEREIDKLTLKKKLDQYQAEIATMEEERKTLRVRKTDYVALLSEVIDSFRKLPEHYQAATPEEKAALLRPLAETIRISGDAARILWKKPYSIIFGEEVVRVCADVRARPDETRTVISAQAYALIRYLAA